MSSDPLLQLITDVDSAQYLIRKPNIQDNVNNVRREFVGKPEVCHKLVEHIIYLRRDIDTEHHWTKFKNLIDEYLDVLLREYDVRWMLSILDTLVDHGAPLQKATAMTIVAFIKSINISYTLLDAAMDGRLDANKLKNRRVPKRATVEGMLSCDIYTGDMLSYLNERLNNTAELDPTVNAIWCEIKSRLKDDQQVPLYWLCAFHVKAESRKFFQ